MNPPTILFVPVERRLGTRMSRRIFSRLTAWVLLFCGLLRPSVATEAPPDLIPVTMMVGFSATGFLQGNRNDIQSAFKALAETIGRERGFRVTVKTQTFSDAAAYHEAIRAGEINFAIFDSLAFVSEPRLGGLSPVFSTANEGTAGRRYQVLVRRDSGLRTLADLRGKSIVELQAPNLNIGHTWLLNRLLALGVRNEKKFFRSVTPVVRPSAAVLPVFFGRSDACLVDDLGFKLMVELNPQVGTQLQQLEISEPLVGAVLCASETNWSALEFRPALLSALGELHEEPAGQQILTLFKIDQLVPFQESHLENVRELWSTYSNQLKEVRP